MADRVGLSGMTFYGYHGVSPQERALGQRFVVDLELERDLTVAGRSDQLADTVDYGAVYQVVREVMEGPPRNLLERLAEDIAQRLLEEFPLEAALVRVRKPQVPIRDAVLDEAWVEVLRCARQDP